MKLNKAQKITIIIALLAMTIMTLFPPVATVYNHTMLLPMGRGFLFSIRLRHGSPIDINTKRLSFEYLMVILLGSTLIALFSLKRNN